MCVFTFSATFFRYVSHCEKNSATYYHKCTYISLKVPVIFSDCKQNYFFQHIFEKSLNIKWMKIRPVGDELFHGDGRTWRT